MTHLLSHLVCGSGDQEGRCFAVPLVPGRLEEWDMWLLGLDACGVLAASPINAQASACPDEAGVRDPWTGADWP
jgi:hypothetical protein